MKKILHWRGCTEFSEVSNEGGASKLIKEKKSTAINLSKVNDTQSGRKPINYGQAQVQWTWVGNNSDKRNSCRHGC